MQKYLCGIDEAGRGPLAGPVIAAAVILPEGLKIEELTDSKKLTAKKREKLEKTIKNKATAWAIGRAEAKEIDDINILQASLLAMKRAVEGLTTQPTHTLIDGCHTPKNMPCSATAHIKGDQKFACISAASILAKVQRDTEMMELAKTYPQYGFEQHKGYPTKKHIKALEQHGPCEIHRKSFAPVSRNMRK